MLSGEEDSALPDMDTKIYGREELLMRLQAEVKPIAAQRTQGSLRISVCYLRFVFMFPYQMNVKKVEIIYPTHEHAWISRLTY